ncbi:hypothetical protein [Duganella callida]|uniref:Uncharacterized protein n=1 Tax=Duganella callida TaxID=2561932 RepID=A0A4Y9SPT1_9BURK|nr:hypothetical protein [Duganella callida]TFW27244.1 hypothetical protein E4L98_07290 [Duganella callida]
MNQTSLDKQSGDAEDDHLARIVRLETNMENVASILLQLQRREEEHFHYTLAELTRLRDRIDSSRDRMDHLHQIAMDKIDRNTYWIIGLMFAHITATVGILVRLMIS